VEIVRTPLFVLGILSAAVGVWRDVHRSEEENPGDGLWGTLRPVTRGAVAWAALLPGRAVLAVGLAAFVPVTARGMTVEIGRHPQA
jgi:hypothetical protein